MLKTSLAHLASNLYFGINCSHHNVHLYFFYWVQKPDAQISIKIGGGLPMIIIIVWAEVLGHLNLYLNYHPYLLNYSLNLDPFPKQWHNLRINISKEGTIGLEKCDLLCSLYTCQLSRIWHQSPSLPYRLPNPPDKNNQVISFSVL